MAASGDGKSVKDQQQELLETFRDMQSELQDLMLKQQQMEAQINENSMVKAEFDKLTDDDEVHKLTGPVLVKTPVADAKTAIDSRLKFIEEQLKSVSRALEAKQEEQDALRSKIVKFQQENAAALAEAAAAGPSAGS